MTDRLIGVGVGPGDPDLVTVKAVRILREAGTILVPAIDEAPSGRQRHAQPGSTEPGRAETTVLAHLDPDRRHLIRRVGFAMREPAGPTAGRQAAWRAAADAVLWAFDSGAGPVAFATIGDPSVYSTFSYLTQAVREQRPDVIVELVPGITAMQDLAARSGLPLCEGAETLTLVPATAGLDTVRAALGSGDTVVTYKAGRQLPALLSVLKEAGRLRDTVIGCGLGLPEEKIIAADQLDPTQAAPYLTTVLAARRRPNAGGER